MQTNFPDISELGTLSRIVRLDMQSNFASFDVFQKLRDIAQPISSQFHSIAAAVGQLVSIRPTFFLSGKTEGDKLKGLNYLAVTDTIVQVPEGMSSTMTAYLSTLLASVNHDKDIVKDHLNPFLSFLEDVDTNRSSMNSVSKYSGALKSQATQRDKLNASMGKCFKHGSHSTSAKLSTVFVSKADYVEAVDQTEALNIWLGKIYTKAVQSVVDRICVVLDRIAENISKGNITDASKTNIQHLADCAYDVGREVEFFALLVYRIQTVSASMNSSSEKLGKMVA